MKKKVKKFVYQWVVNDYSFTYDELQQLIKTVCDGNWTVQELADTVLNLSAKKYKVFIRRMTSVLQNVDAVNDLLQDVKYAKSEEENE